MKVLSLEPLSGSGWSLQGWDFIALSAKVSDGEKCNCATGIKPDGFGCSTFLDFFFFKMKLTH